MNSLFFVTCIYFCAMCVSEKIDEVVFESGINLRLYSYMTDITKN
jgi:hypothetical protein